MKLTTIATIASVAAAYPLAGHAQFTVAPAPDLCGSPCVPSPPVYSPDWHIPAPYYPPIGYGIAAPPHDPEFDTPPQVICDDLGNGFVSCREY